MRINYSILWVEDEKSWYETTKELFTDTLDELGFNLICKRVENLKQVKDEFELNGLKDYDLLLIDYTLKNAESGDHIIEFIRGIKVKPILTDILFYSSAVEKVRESMHKLGLEGVYTADRKDIVPKFDLVVNTTIKKVQDLNNIRGLIMAETSDIDKIMFDIIQVLITSNKFDLKEKLSNEIFLNIEKKVNGKKEDFEKYKRNSNLNRIMNDTVIFDAFEKLNLIQFIFENVNDEIANKYKNGIFKTSYSEITKKRNLLGHVSQSDNIGPIIVGSGDYAFEFNDEFCIDIRNKIRNYSSDLIKFKNSIT